MDYTLFKNAVGVFATLGLYSVLYKENKTYRFFEHVFLGLASGWALVIIWTETLKSNWWDKMVGHAAEGKVPAMPGYWLYAILLPIGIMGYFVFSKKHNWLSRIPIGIILGMYSGQQFAAWQQRYIGQLNNAMRPLLPTTSAFFRPALDGLNKADAAAVKSTIYGSQALTNWIYIITLLSVVGYFLFSFDHKNKFIARVSMSGRWLLMIGFGAIFGSTVMMRFTLLIDRMYFVWIEFVKSGLLHR